LIDLSSISLLLVPTSAGWQYYSATDHSFYVSATKADQESARTQCQQMGADLASITDQQEMDFVISISSVSSHSFLLASKTHSQLQPFYALCLLSGITGYTRNRSGF